MAEVLLDAPLVSSGVKAAAVATLVDAAGAATGMDMAISGGSRRRWRRPRRS